MIVFWKKPVYKTEQFALAPENGIHVANKLTVQTKVI